MLSNEDVQFTTLCYIFVCSPCATCDRGLRPNDQCHNYIVNNSYVYENTVHDEGGNLIVIITLFILLFKPLPLTKSGSFFQQIPPFLGRNVPSYYSKIQWYVGKTLNSIIIVYPNVERTCNNQRQQVLRSWHRKAIEHLHTCHPLQRPHLYSLHKRGIAI